MRTTDPNRAEFLMLSNRVLCLCRGERAEMLLLTAARGAGETGWSVLTDHQHKHTEEEMRERRGGVLYKTRAAQPHSC